MALSKKKQTKMARKKRENFVLSVAITQSPSAPFMDANWDDAARRYIETGDESLKELFPTHLRRSS